MTELQKRMIECLQLRGLSERTQKSYVRAVRQLAKHYHKSPDLITEEELRQYFLYLKNVKLYSRPTMTIAICGVRFLYQQTLNREWTIFGIVRPAPEKKLPVILTIEEVLKVLGSIRIERYRVCLSTIYSCGLRLQEGIGLAVPDIDSARQMIHVRHGKGNKDRYVPLPDRTLELLRQYWKTHRNPVLLFPAEGRNHIDLAKSTEPMSKSSVQMAFRAALKQSGINKRASVHTLRHSWATHLLEAGVNLRLIQEWLGPEFTGNDQCLYASHGQSRTTRIASHQPDHEPAPAPHASVMIEMAEIFRLHGEEYRAKFGQRMLPSHFRAMDDIEQCRTASLGGQLYYCNQCQQERYSYHSCKNRHCPKCQNDQANQWLEEQKSLLLPVPHFMVTFTLPAELRDVARSNQKLIYNILFRASSEALQKLAADPRFVGGRLGMLGVLQTWTRQLVYHPHVHYIVTGGGLTDDDRWRASRKDFLVHETPLAMIFRARFRDQLKKAGLFAQVDRRVWKKDWVVDCEAVGSGVAAFKYLAPYIFRVAISNNRILKLEDGRVTFKYKDSATHQIRFATLAAEEFIRRFLQHVLPPRFVKVRYFGLMSPGNRHLLTKARELLSPGGELNSTHRTEQKTTEPEPGVKERAASPCCPTCGTILTLIRELRRGGLPP